MDPRTENLMEHLRADEIAVIDHLNIDRVSTEVLVTCDPLVVVNAVKSTLGRYPNLEPGILNAAGVPLVDDCEPKVMKVGEGTRVCVTETGGVYAGEELAATGIVQVVETITVNQEDAKADISVQLKAFIANMTEYIEYEQDLIFDGVEAPDVEASFERHCILVVVRGYRHKEDLAVLRSYIHKYRPTMTGVDSGAGAVSEEEYKLSMIVGDMDSVSDKALTCGAEIVVHAYRNGRAPGNKRVDEFGTDHVIFPYTGTSEDVAIPLVDDKGAKLIVALGTHNALIELLDKRRPGMASIFLTHLAVEGKLIDAKGVSQLYRSHTPNWQIFAFLLTGCITIGAAMVSTATGRATFGLASAWFGGILRWFGSSF